MYAASNSAERPVIQLREWETWPGALSGEQAAELQRVPRQVATVAFGPGSGWRISSTSWVGNARLSTFDLRIVPKIPMASVLGLIEAELELLQFTGTGTVGFPSELEDLLGRTFVDEMERIIRRGLRRDYVNRQEELPFARARINLARTALLNVTGRPRMDCTFEDFEQDSPENRALAHTLIVIATTRATFTAGLRTSAAKYAAMMPPRREVTASEMDVLAARSRDIFYRSALRLGALILRALGFSDDPRGRTGQGFWVDMNRLFQAFVARALEGAFRGTEFVVMREPPRYLDHDRRVLLKPDVVVRYANGELPLDAKYKDLVDAAQEDVYQVLAYCRGLTSHEGFIVLPGNQPPTSIRCTGGEQIVISRLDLASRAAMQTSANNLARAVRAHMQRAITGLTKPPPG